MPNLDPPKSENADFYFVEASEPEDGVFKIIEIVKNRLPNRFGFDPIKDVQVLCPMNRGGLGARALNVDLQKALNPPRDEIFIERFGFTYRVGDKVMQTDNNYDKDVFNGDLIKVGGVLIPYKKIVENCVSPAEPWKHPVRLSLGRKSISDYRKAIGDPEGLAELMLFYAECGVNFTLEFGDIDEPFYNSVASVFCDGLKTFKRCEPDTVSKLLPRFVNAVQSTSGIGWGFHDGFRDAVDAYFPDAQ